jgi:hypothetical protein
MIPIGKVMAEALLEESDESTVSLSDLESIEGEQTVPSGYPNPKAKPFTPYQVERGYAGFITPTKVASPHLDLEARPRCWWNVSQYPHTSSLLSNNGHVIGSACHHVALDCESEFHMNS